MNKESLNSHLSDGALVAKLSLSSIYQSYQDAFRKATGLPLVLQLADGRDPDSCTDDAVPNRFCQLLNGGPHACEQCIMASRCLKKNALQRSHTIECFAGLKETAAPVRLGKKTVAFLRTGQIFTSSPSEEDFESIADSLKESGRTPAEIEELREAYLCSRVVGEEEYFGAMTLLSAFALQLSDLAHRLVLSTQDSEPQTISKAKQYIEEHLDERMSLEEVSTAVNVSTFYLCKLFKSTTDLTFTEYVNRARIERAKQALLNPSSSVTEIAYDVGFQSLSQFNRSFRRLVGMSPTNYRSRLRIGSLTRFQAA